MPVVKQGFDFDNCPNSADYFIRVNSLDDLEVVRNTLLLLNEIWLTAETTAELESEVCKEIYYTSVNVMGQLTKLQHKFMRALNVTNIEPGKYNQISDQLGGFMSML